MEGRWGGGGCGCSSVGGGRFWGANCERKRRRGCGRGGGLGGRRWWRRRGEACWRWGL